MHLRAASRHPPRGSPFPLPGKRAPSRALGRRRLGWLAAFLYVWAGAVLAGAPASVTIYDMEVNGKIAPLPSSLAEQKNGVRVTSDTRTVGFRFGPGPGGSAKPVRLRYRLQGWDAQWREPAGEMRLNVKFLDAEKKIVSAQDFNAARSRAFSGAAAGPRGRRGAPQSWPMRPQAAFTH